MSTTQEKAEKPIDTLRKQVGKERVNVDTLALVRQSANYYSVVKFLNQHKLTFEQLKRVLEEEESSNSWIASITELNLRGNNVTQLPLLFPSLTHLDLSYNDMNKCTDVKLNAGLKVLNLNNNRLSVSAVDQMNLEKQSVEHLDLSNNLFTCIPESVCEHFEKLTYLDVSGNNMMKQKRSVTNFLSKRTVLLPNDFEKLLKGNIDNFATSMQHLFARDCKLHKLPSQIGRLVNLVTLDLSNNPIASQQISPDLSFHNLKTLNLSSCRLTSIPTHLFEKSKELETLKLNDNQITAFNLTIQLAHLRTLDISNNSFIVRESDEFMKWFNKGSNIARCPMLQSLSIAGNPGLAFMLVHEDFSLEAYTELTSLDLKSNELTSLPNGIEVLKKLVTLDAPHNFINRLPEAVFTQLPQLNFLNLADNSLPDAALVNSSGDYSGLANLICLDISCNKLHQFPKHLIHHLPSILQINLDNSASKIEIDNEVAEWRSDRDVQIARTLTAPDQILERLYLGSAASARSKYYMKSIGITHVLTVARGLPPVHPIHFKYHVVDIEDVEEENISEHFAACHKFMDEAMESGGVLVHCRAGVSRSASVVISYVMKRHKMTADEALQFVKQKRNQICPNSAFFQQLQAFEKSVNML